MKIKKLEIPKWIDIIILLIAITYVRLTLDGKIDGDLLNLITVSLAVWGGNMYGQSLKFEKLKKRVDFLEGGSKDKHI